MNFIFMGSRFKATDVPGSIVKGAPDFCNVFVISKGKIQSMRSASRPAPTVGALRGQLAQQCSTKSDTPDFPVSHSASARGKLVSNSCPVWFFLICSLSQIFSMKLMLNLLAVSLDKPPLDLPNKSQDEADFMRLVWTLCMVQINVRLMQNS